MHTYERRSAVDDAGALDRKNNMNKLSTEYQKKFEFYFLALVFTILGLTIQTSAFTLFGYQYIFEILGWIALLISGLAGLSKMEWLPIIFKHMEEKQIDEQHKSDLTKASNFNTIDSVTRQPISKEKIEGLIQTVEGRIKQRTETINMIEKRHTIKYQLHKWCFVAGLALLILSRSIYHIHNLENEINKSNQQVYSTSHTLGKCPYTLD